MDLLSFFFTPTFAYIAGTVVLSLILALVFRATNEGFQGMATAVASGAVVTTDGITAPQETCNNVKKQLDIYEDLKKTHTTPIQNIDNTITQMKEALRNYGCTKYFNIE
jgi:hypothetical protein